MANLIEITLPAQAEALSTELEQRLIPYADVTRQSPAILSLETIKLVNWCPDQWGGGRCCCWNNSGY